MPSSNRPSTSQKREIIRAICLSVFFINIQNKIIFLECWIYVAIPDISFLHVPVLLVENAKFFMVHFLLFQKERTQKQL